MTLHPGSAHTAWRANLDLEFKRREDTTILSRNLHVGPLQVQKALYPEGRDTCHVVVLHPPGGIAAGDALTVRASAAAGSRAVLTTPGAAKWYRSERDEASQQVSLSLAGDAVMEWLPRENIIFDRARIRLQLDVELSDGARFFGWEILGFGRRASGERWNEGTLRMETRIRRAGRLIWSELARIDAADGFMSSPVGMRGCSVAGTFLLAGYEVGDELLRECRAVTPAGVGDGVADCEVGLTRLPALLVVRYLGHSAQQALHWFTDLWRLLRPVVHGRAACVPRVWAC